KRELKLCQFSSQSFAVGAVVLNAPTLHSPASQVPLLSSYQNPTVARPVCGVPPVQFVAFILYITVQFVEYTLKMPVQFVAFCPSSLWRLVRSIPWQPNIHALSEEDLLYLLSFIL
ncbi:hypothetical protein, partial [Deinococcus marmoris]|uniref:hypothetical protein n=1 Tax=Deinococcus marmoris TaxID=249408 RepID=UPI0039EED6A2